MNDVIIAPVLVPVAQLVRASVCGTEGRGFKSHQAPHEANSLILYRHKQSVGFPQVYSIFLRIVIQYNHINNKRLVWWEVGQTKKESVIWHTQET